MSYEDVAVIGISGVFPEAADLGELFRNLDGGRDSVRALPRERIETTSVDPTLDYPTVGCLDRIDLFDHKHFNISLREAEYMDPHQRVTLELVCAAVENAGYAPSALRGTRTGVYLSAPRPEYYELFRDVDPLELLGNAPSALAGRISYVLDLHGPSLVLDSGCCGSLVAVDAACRELFAGESRFAIAGGVALTVLFEPETTTAAFQEIMSPGGKCRAFDASADGTAAGEGGAIVVLKLLRHALEDGDHVHAVIKGAAVNQNGYRSNGLSAPSPAAQAEVIRAAWDVAGVDPASIGYVEAHGSGTRLGDVIEVQGLSEAFRAVRRAGPCPIGSVKTNVGHLDHAAGIAGMVKAILSLKHGRLLPSLHFDRPNPLIDFEDAVRVQTEAAPWESPGPRRAGVSSFSLAGTNVHMVLEEAPAREARAPSTGPELVTLSAKSGAALRDYCRSVARFATASEHDLATIAATLNRGRDDHQVRAAAVVGSKQELVSWLEATALGAEALQPVPREPRSLALLFSGDEEVPGQAFEAMLDHLSPVGSVVEMPDGAAPGLRLFGWHQALHSMIRSLGLTEASVLGSGAGNLTVRTLVAGLDVEEAAREAASVQPSGHVDVGKLAAAVTKLGSDVVFLEMGGDGVLGRSVRAVRPDADVMALLRGGRSALHALAELYVLGVAIDWERYYDGRSIPRIEAPAYPFQRERCWCRPLGDYRRHGTDHAPDEVRALIDTPEAAPAGSFSTDTERALAGIWREALKVEPEDAGADYFDLGGTSITGMVVLDGVARDFGVRIAFQDLYEHSTLGELAARIDTMAPMASGPGSEPPIEPIPRGGYLPVSYGQEQIWFLDQLEPGTPLYNIPFDLHLKGDLDRGALHRALVDLARRHEVLRMGFVAVEGEPRAFVEPEPRVELPFVDLTSMPRAEARAKALRLFDAEATTPFDLSRPPLFRGTLVALGDGDHVLLMTFHHIVYDGWTPSIIQDELSALYDAAKEGRDARLPVLPIQYPDYAHWQKQWMRDEVLEKGLEFWTVHLAGAPPLDLPTDRPRPAVQSYAGGMVSLWIDESVADGLRALSRREGVTMFTTMMAAFDALMARWSGQDDVVVGTPTSGRKKLETRGLIGYFNNMLPLRVRLDGDPSFSELMQRVKTVAAQALDHDDVPFEKMVDALKPGRDLARNPLFQVAYSHQNAPQEGYELRGLEVSTFGEGDIRGIAPGTAKFDLTLGIGDAGEGELEGYLEYATDLFDQETVEAMIAHLQTMLRAIVADPSLPLSRLPLAPPEERQAWAEGINEPLPPKPAGPFVHHRVAAHAATSPDDVALISDEGTMTVAELHARAGGIAARLHQLGVGRGDVVAVAHARSFDQVAASLGALYAGAAYLPLDPAYPTARLELMVRDAAPAAIVAPPGVRDRLGASGIPFDDAAAFDSWPIAEAIGRAADVEVATPEGDDLAYVIYTSGSTGTPKGVGVTHANLAQLVDWHAFAFPAEQGEVASTVAPLSFDASVWELWSALGNGSPLVLVSDDVRRDPDALVQTLERHRVAHAFVPTALAATLLARPKPAPLKILFVGGDRLTARPPGDYGARVVDLYGPAEATVICTAADVPPDEPGVPHIGSPVTGARVYVLDDDLEPVPPGLPGELYVGGHGVARGYLGRPSMTCERFLPDPFAAEPGARMYRTGDRARVRRDGALDFLGRADDQVKVRGHRIEPAEVEAALLAHDGIREAAVAVRDDRLVAYLSGTAVPTVADLRAFLGEALPAHMIPSAVVALDRLPVTPGGKLARTALPAPGPERPELEDAYDAPETETERTLAEIWSEVLRVDRIGRKDNFFDLGGDSILSIQIVARAASRGLTILPKQVFEAQTVAELARLAQTAATKQERPPAERVTGSVPLTPVQRWFFEQDLAEPHHFNQAMLFELRQPADATALERALHALVEHHDVLRTRWIRDGSGWRAVIPAQESGELLWTAGLSGRDPASAMLEMEAEAARLQASFDLAHGPLVRGVLFDLGPLQPPQLLLSAHHLVVDAISWGVLVHDLATAYGEILRGRTPELPAKTTSFQQWARHLEDRVHAIDPDERTMWIERVAGIEPASLRVDHPGARNDVGSTKEISFELDERTSTAIVESMVHDQDVQPNETLLAVLATAAGAMADGRHMVVDVEGHGREPGDSALELSRTVGWFTTLFPVVVEREADPLVALRSVRDQMRAAPESGIGYGLLRYLGTPADAQPLRDAPQAEVSFNYLGRYEGSIGGTGDLEPAEGPVGPLRSPAGARRHLVEAEAWVAGGRVRVDLVYSGELHDDATMASLRDAFVASAKEIVYACAAGASLDAATSAELAEVVETRPGVADSYPLSPMQQGLLFHSLYETGGSLYFEQLVLTITGPLDAERLERAWGDVAARHPLLGAAVLWEGISEPVMLVPSEPRVEVSHHDWRASGGDLDAYLAEDRARGFDLERSLTRVALIRVADDEHRMVWSHHHLLLDGWSVQLVLGELLDLYDHPDARLDAPGDYKRFVEWLRAGDPAAAAGYWKDALAGFEAPTDLRLVPPAEPGEGHGMISRAFGEEETAAAAAFARAQRVTLNTVAEAAWAATLGVYSGSGDVLFGAIVSGRAAPVEAVERTVGLFINTVPIRTRIPADVPVGEWLKDLQSRALDRRDFEHTPLVDVQAQSGIVAPTPLFDTLIAFENYPLDDVWDEDSSSVQISGKPASENTNYPISMVIAPGDGLTFRLSFDRARVDERSAAALLERFVTMLREVAASATRPVAALSALTEEDRATLARFNETRVDYRNELLVHEMFEARAAAHPGAEAIACGSDSVTYAALNERADALAAHLRDLGVGPDVLVALCCERTIEMVAGMIAVLKAGGAYVPVDPRYPADRIGYMLEDTAAPVLLTDRATAERVPAGNAKVVLLDAVANGSKGVNGNGVRAGERNLAYVLYTSGSTGRPKGIGIEHRSVKAFLDWAMATWDDELKTVMACTSISFDVHVFEIFGTLCSGGTVLLVEDALAFTTLDRREELTLLNAVPSAVDELINAGPLPAGIRTINLPGEPLSRKLVDRIFGASSAQRIVNLYGPTEDTTYSTAAFLMPGEQGPISIGRPIANSWIYLLDRNLNQVPPGVPGEVYIGGAGLARGYFGRPDMTAERFLPDVLAPEPGARMYKTGDLARYRPDGSLDFMGRLDYQIKIRGFRVELGEIEQQLLEHPSVTHCVVVVRDAASGNRRIVAYVTALDSSNPPGPPALRGHVAARVPDYMVPSAIVVLDALPLNPNGKVDRAALPDPDTARSETPTGDGTPATATEKVLASIWRELLEVPGVGRSDSFFELGGQSLLATRLVSRIRETWGVDARLRVVFDAPTLAALASEIENLCGGAEAADAIASAVAEIETLSEEDVRRMLAAMEGEVTGGE